MQTFLLLTLMFVPWAATAEERSIPLCGRISGFAGEVNNKLTIMVDQAVEVNQALIVGVRPVPCPVLGTCPFADDVDVNVTFQSRGIQFNALSDRFGVVYVADKDFTGLLHVSVRNQRRSDAPDLVPFELFSYLMNHRACSVELTPAKPFIGPIPPHLPPQEVKVGYFYMVAHPPLGVESFTVTVSGSSATVYYSSSQTEYGVPLVSGKPCAWSGGDIYFTVQPRDEVSTAEMLRASISYQIREQPSNNNNNAPGQPAPPGQPPGSPSPVTTPDDSARNTAPSSAPNGNPSAAANGSWSGFGMFLVVVLTYFSVRTIYNYRVQQITRFPEFIPHHEALASVGSCLAALASHAKNKGRQVVFTRSGYNAVNREDIYDTTVH